MGSPREPGLLTGVGGPDLKLNDGGKPEEASMATRRRIPTYGAAARLC